MKKEIKYLPFKLNDVINIKKIITIHYQEIDFPYVYSGESHNFWEMIYVDKNCIDLKVKDKTFSLNQKQIAFIKPNDFHSLSCAKYTNILVLSFDTVSPFLDYFNDKVFTLNDNELDLLLSIIKEAKDTFKIPRFDPNIKYMELLESPALGGQQLIKNYLEIFLITLLRNETKKDNPEILFYSKSKLSIEEEIIKYLKDNLYNQLNLDKLANSLHFSKSYLCAVFKAKYKTSIIKYYISLKIEEGKKLLLQGESVKNIASLLNFNDVSHFSNSFKKAMGISPNNYKGKQK